MHRLEYLLVAGGGALGSVARYWLSGVVDLPMIIEIVDSEERIQSLLPVLDGMITGGLVTMEKVRALHYRGAVNE